MQGPVPTVLVSQSVNVIVRVCGGPALHTLESGVQAWVLAGAGLAHSEGEVGAPSVAVQVTVCDCVPLPGAGVHVPTLVWVTRPQP